MKLTKEEIDSELWRKLSACCDGLIEKAHMTLEKTVTTHDETMQLRGSIRTLRNIKRLGSAPVAMGTDEEKRYD